LLSCFFIWFVWLFAVAHSCIPTADRGNWLIVKLRGGPFFRYGVKPDRGGWRDSIGERRLVFRSPSAPDLRELGIGVKRHRYDCVFNWIFHVRLRYEFFPFFLAATTNSAGSGQRCPGVYELRLAAKQEHHNDNDQQQANTAAADPDGAGKNRTE
jgi:hypothetical protein